MEASRGQCTRPLIIFAALLPFMYLLSSGPAHAIWPDDWRGESSVFTLHSRTHWREPVASVFAPLAYLRDNTLLKRPLQLYWQLFDRENFYCNEFSDHSNAIKFSRIGIAFRGALGAK